MNKNIALLAILTIIPFAASASSQKTSERKYQLAEEVDTIKLSELINAVSKNNEKKFLINAKSRAEVVAYGIDANNLTYDQFLSILDNNYMAAVESNGYINIVPIQNVRWMTVPEIKDGDKVDNDLLWVTKIINTGSLKATKLIPILRPLVMQRAHFAGYSDANSIIMTAPYGSIKRIEHLISTLQKEKASLNK